MDPLSYFSDCSEDEGDEEETPAEKIPKRKFDYKELVERGYHTPDLSSFVEGYREIERKEEEEVQAKKRKQEEQDAEYAADIAKAKAFTQKWDTWLEPAAEEAKLEREAKRQQRLAAQQKRNEEGDKPWFAHGKSEELPALTSTPVPSSQLIALSSSSGGGGSGSGSEEVDESSSLVPIPTAPQTHDKSFPLVDTNQNYSGEKRVLTFDSTGNHVLAVVAATTTTTTTGEGGMRKKNKMTHAQKLAKKYEEDKRKEAQGLFDKRKGGGIENLPVKQNVNSYKQRLNNIMHMERNLDTLLNKGKPTFKDQRSDMAYDDLRKCGAGAAN